MIFKGTWVRVKSIHSGSQHCIALCHKGNLILLDILLTGTVGVLSCYSSLRTQ